MSRTRSLSWWSNVLGAVFVCGALALEPASPEDVVRRTTLLEKVWDMHFDPGSNVVDVHVGNLRRKLTTAAGEQLIQTVRGVGFTLRRAANGATP